MDGVQDGIYRSADLEIDPSLAALRRGDETIHLRPKTFQVLLYLIERRDRLVTKEELIENLWDGVAVTDDTVVQCIADLRRHLGDDPRHPQWIKTVPRLGYHFIGDVEVLHAAGGGVIEIEEVTTIEAEIVEKDESEPQARWPNAAIAANQNTLICVLALLAIMFGGLWLWGLRERRPVVGAALPSAPGKHSVVVLGFENQSGGGRLDWLQEGLPDMLITGLTRSAHLIVLSRSQLAVLFDRTGIDDDPEISLETGMEIARRANARIFITGSFSQMGESIRVDLRCHDGRDGGLMFADGFIVDRPEDLLTQIDLLAMSVAARISGDGREPEPR